jgi:hypothetical protein
MYFDCMKGRVLIMVSICYKFFDLVGSIGIRMKCILLQFYFY